MAPSTENPSSGATPRGDLLRGFERAAFAPFAASAAYALLSRWYILLFLEMVPDVLVVKGGAFGKFLANSLNWTP